MALIKPGQLEPIISDKEMLDLINKYCQAIKSRNWDLLRLIITQDCVWRWPGTNDESGTAIGTDAVIKQVSDMTRRVLDLQLVKILYGVTGVAMSLHFQTVLSGEKVDEDMTTVCNLRGYLISGINNYLSKVDELPVS
jgi:ketosteroid isomerase-like protein